jgi:hypothetical protein
LQCKAGGSFVNGQNQHLQGSILDFKYFLTGDRAQFDLDRRYTWIKCNKDFKGFYFTDYVNDMYQAFDQVLLNKPDTFSVGDRANLIHVSFEAAYSGLKSYLYPSLLTNFLQSGEFSLTVWRTLFFHLNRIALVAEHRPVFASLRVIFITSLIYFHNFLIKTLL